MRRDATKGSDPLVAFRGEVVFGEEQWRMVLSAEWEAWGLRWSEGVTKATKGSDPFDAFRRAWLLFDF